jgi:hypothetical protein
VFEATFVAVNGNNSIRNSACAVVCEDLYPCATRYYKRAVSGIVFLIEFAQKRHVRVGVCHELEEKKTRCRDSEMT